MTVSCSQCGAVFTDSDRSCAERFDALLAFDHSREEPWGSRHGLAFSTFALQHPEGRSAEQLTACWIILYRVWVKGDNRAKLAAAMRVRQNAPPAEWDVPGRPSIPPAGTRYAVTIADLAEFNAETYVKKLEEWGRATLVTWMTPARC